MLPTFLFSALDLEEVEGSSSFTKKSPFPLRSQFLLEPSILLSPMYWFHDRTASVRRFVAMQHIYLTANKDKRSSERNEQISLKYDIYDMENNLFVL